MNLPFKARCTGCKQETAGRLHFDEQMRLVDSDGGLLFSDGWRCHNCLGEPWASGDVEVTL
jgi:hypothetical protein